MKINCNNRDLKIDRNYEHSCFSCAFGSSNNLHWCRLFCRSGKIWIKDIFNSDIFKV
jgi:hypothetical protein